MNRVGFDQHVDDVGTIVLYICADNLGDVTQIQVLRSKSTIKDLKTLSAVANEALKMKFNAVRRALPQCGEMTFTFEQSTGRKDIISASKQGQNKVFGSRPMPPSTNVETGDLGQRKILRHANIDVTTDEPGQIVVYICADKYGRVIKAQAVRGKSSIKQADVLLSVSRAIQQQMRFAPANQQDCMYYKINIE